MRSASWAAISRSPGASAAFLPAIWLPVFLSVAIHFGGLSVGIRPCLLELWQRPHLFSSCTIAWQILRRRAATNSLSAWMNVVCPSASAARAHELGGPYRLAGRDPSRGSPPLGRTQLVRFV